MRFIPSLTHTRIKTTEQEDGRQEREMFAKSDKASSDIKYPSAASTINGIIEKTMKSLFRFLEGKVRQVN
jgi:hypothetical protein